MKGIKNTLAIIGGLTVANVIYKAAKRIKESGVTVEDLKKQGEKISEDMENFMDKKKMEKEVKDAVEGVTEEVKEAVTPEEDKKEENKQG